MNMTAGAPAARLHLRPVPAEVANEPEREYFVTRVNNGEVVGFVGPLATRTDADTAAKAMKGEFGSARILITVAVAEVRPVEEPLRVVDLP